MTMKQVRLQQDREHAIVLCSLRLASTMTQTATELLGEKRSRKQAKRRKQANAVSACLRLARRMTQQALAAMDRVADGEAWPRRQLATLGDAR